MKRIVPATVAASVLLLCSQPSASTLIGTELKLRVIAQATPSSELLTISFPVAATVKAESVEFPNVESLFDPATGVPPGFARSLVNVAIDAGADFLTIDFDNTTSPFRYASGFQNTYVFTFDSDFILTLISAEIDTSVTTLGLTPGRVTVSGNELFVNVQGLSFTTSTFARITLASRLDDRPPTAVPTPGALPLLLGGLAMLSIAARRRSR